jgi:hypothetical protein
LPRDQLPENRGIFSLETLQNTVQWHLRMQHRLILFVPHPQQKIACRVILHANA